MIRYKYKKCFNVFPFHVTDDDELNVSCSNIDKNIDEYEQHNENSLQNFSVIHHINENHIIFHYINPDSNFFDSVSIDCNNYTDYQFLKTFNIHQDLSIAHFSC